MNTNLEKHTVHTKTEKTLVSLRNMTVIWNERYIYLRMIDDVSKKRWTGQPDPNSSLPEHDL